MFPLAIQKIGKFENNNSDTAVIILTNNENGRYAV